MIVRSIYRIGFIQGAGIEAKSDGKMKDGEEMEVLQLKGTEGHTKEGEIKGPNWGAKNRVQARVSNAQPSD